jgi:hypothetical protein
MGSLPILWEDPYVGRLTVYRKMTGLPLLLGRLPMYGKTSQLWEVFPYIGSFQCMGGLPMYGKAS